MICVGKFLPKVFVLENVHGISYSGKEEGFRLLQRLADVVNKETGSNYTLSWTVLNSADYGVPQQRKRFFLIGHREGERFVFPEPSHVESMSTGLLGFQEYLTAWDAIGAIEPNGEDLEAKGYWADLLPSIPEGENYLWHTNRKGGRPLFGWRTRYWSFLLKLAKHKTSWTIQANPGPAIGPFHWSNRLLSIEEMSRLQTFPQGLSFAGSRRSIQRQLGNAVPSLLAEVVAREIAKQFFNVEYSNPPQLSIRRHRPIPPPEPITEVPTKYQHLVGEHPDHPGEGKGGRVKKLKKQPMLTHLPGDDEG
jgi:DNA (cytosine-5)-methyltransferase 1